MLSYYLSVGSELYQQGGFFEGSEFLAELEARSTEADFIVNCGELFPAYRYSRLIAASSLVGSDAFIDKLTTHYTWINQVFDAGASTRLARLSDVYVCRNAIYKVRDNAVVTLYETSRPVDRPYSVPIPASAAELQSSALGMTSKKPSLYLGSAGYFNYGHWLIDDLVRADADRLVVQATGRDEVEFIIPGHTPELNDVKRQSVLRMEKADIKRSICFVPFEAALHFDELFYATPVSYHPVLKSPFVPQVLRRMRLDFSKSLMVQGKPRIYLTRNRGRGRFVANDEDVCTIFSQFGFVMVDVEGLSFDQQIMLVRNAEVVAGCMGAAMTSTVFCSPSTKVIYLAPEGWMEPFYWDLAGTCGHDYFALYGPLTNPEQEAHTTPFTIEPKQLQSLLYRVVA